MGLQFGPGVGKRGVFDVLGGLHECIVSQGLAMMGMNRQK
jgi:hypothetical protein